MGRDSAGAHQVQAPVHAGAVVCLLKSASAAKIIESFFRPPAETLSARPSQTAWLTPVAPTR
jgi:hypothetical protein